MVRNSKQLHEHFWDKVTTNRLILEYLNVLISLFSAIIEGTAEKIDEEFCNASLFTLIVIYRLRKVSISFDIGSHPFRASNQWYAKEQK